MGGRAAVARVSYFVFCVLCCGSERPFSYSTNNTYFVESWISNRQKRPTFAHS
jgi:hypothetical protein